MIPTKCNICDETCISATDLAQHKLNRHCMFARGASDCVHCRSSVSTEADFITHMIKHNISPSNCPPSSNKSPLVTCKQQKQTVLPIGHDSVSLTMVDSSSPSVVDKEKRSTSLYDPIGELIRWPVTCVVCKLSLNSLDNVIIHGQFHCNGDDGKKSPQGSAGPSEKFEIPSSKDCGTNIFETYQPSKMDQYTCALCQSDHKNLAQLTCHLMDVHEFPSNRKKEIKCPVCVEIFSDRSKFFAHWKHLHLIDYYSTTGQPPVNIGHDKQPIHRCGRCDMRFWFQSERYNHELRQHEISPSSVSSCLIPHEIFTGDHRDSASQMDSEDRWASHMDHVESDKEDVSAEDGGEEEAEEEEEEDEVMEKDERPIDDEDVTCVNVNQGDEEKEGISSQRKEKSLRLAAVNGDEDGP